MAGLWMRVDPIGADPRTGGRWLALENMQERAVRGTTDWTRADIVLDVAEEAGAVLFGFLLDGPGRAYLRNLAFEEVGTDVPTTETAGHLPDAPGDLDFREIPPLG